MPKPVMSSAVQPPMPIIIMTMRFLKRRMFRMETLCRNGSRFQSSGSRSSRMRLPAFGALGRISSAAGFCSSACTTYHVVPSAHSRYAPDETSASGQSKAYRMLVKPYMILYACQIIFGRKYEPAAMPSTQPRTEAIPA